MTDRDCAFKQPILAWLICAPIVAAYVLWVISKARGNNVPAP